MDAVDRIRELCLSRGISISRLERECGFFIRQKNNVLQNVLQILQNKSPCLCIRQGVSQGRKNAYSGDPFRYRLHLV
ncbi:MAG: hypothetical protein IIY21_09445, partial [Clostridiales bacterium]|nr:hypothetical protein [Clostridiales bacterium]